MIRSIIIILKLYLGLPCFTEITRTQIVDFAILAMEHSFCREHWRSVGKPMLVGVASPPSMLLLGCGTLRALKNIDTKLPYTSIGQSTTYPKARHSLSLEGLSQVSGKAELETGSGCLDEKRSLVFSRCSVSSSFDCHSP